jgi:Na+/proline symporter
MDPESKKLLEETYSLEEENNRMLHALKRSMLWSRIMSVIYWILILGISVGAFYFIQPFLDQATSMYDSIKSNIDSASSLFSDYKK